MKQTTLSKYKLKKVNDSCDNSAVDKKLIDLSEMVEASYWSRIYSRSQMENNEAAAYVLRDDYLEMLRATHNSPIG